AECTTHEDPAAGPALPAASVPAADGKESSAHKEEFKPAIADSYNNLGVISAGNKDYVTATDYFKKAGLWNPGLETLDHNLGMAAFYANQFDQSVEPLGRYVESHPDDLRARAALGLSLF